MISARCIRKTRSGSSYLVVENGRVNIKEIFVRPDLSEINFEADIAIAVLEESIEVSENIRHICLNKQPIESFVGQDAIVVGWKLAKNNENSTQMEEVSISIVDKSICPRLNNESIFCPSIYDESRVFNGII